MLPPLAVFTDPGFEVPESGLDLNACRHYIILYPRVNMQQQQ